MRIGTLQPSAIVDFLKGPPASARGDGLPIVAASAGLACVVAVVACLLQGMTAPLWLDETWTGAFASLPSPVALAEQMRNDNNAPLYYGLVWCGARVFGVSNLALHVPGVLFAAATPIVAWLGLRGSRPMLAPVWAALLASWTPGIVQAGDARCYTLLTCLSVAATVAAIRALDRPTRARAVAWAAAACLMTLTHYYAGLLAACQGMVLVAYHRARIRDVWPAALAFLPALAWIAWHAPRLAAYARPDVVWYDPLTVADLRSVFAFLIGSPTLVSSLAAALAVGLLLPESVSAGIAPAARRDRAVLAAGFAALAAVALCLGLAVLRPTFIFRYLTPFVPGVLLLVAAGGVGASRSRWQPIAVLIGGSIVGTTLFVASEDVALNKPFSFEAASRWIAEAAPTRLAFFWDNPTTAAISPSQLDLVGGFFLRRAGLAIAVAPVRSAVPGEDMNDAVLAAAGPSGAVLWLYDTSIRRTSAIGHPPRLPGSEAGLACRNFGLFNLGVLACRKSAR